MFGKVMVTAMVDRYDLLRGKNEFGFQCDLRKEEASTDNPTTTEMQTDLREKRASLLGLQNGVLLQGQASPCMPGLPVVCSLRVSGLDLPTWVMFGEVWSVFLAGSLAVSHCGRRGRAFQLSQVCNWAPAQKRGLPEWAPSSETGALFEEEVSAYAS